MRALAPEIQDKIVARYAAREDVDAIVFALGVSTASVYKTLKLRGIEKRKGAEYRRHEGAIVKLYSEKKSAEQIGRELGLAPSGVLDALRRAGVETRTRSEVNTRHTCDENAFATITPESAYWIGMLLTDGCVSGKSVILQLAEVDAGHVEKFRAFLKATNKISRGEDARPGRESKFARLAVYSETLVKDLARLGVVPRKTMSAKAPSSLVADSDFWRAAVDGDGTVGFSRKGYPILELCGSKNLMHQFLKFVLSVSPDCEASVRPWMNIFRVRLVSRNAQAMVVALYSGAQTALERKYKIAQKIINTSPVLRDSGKNDMNSL